MVVLVSLPATVLVAASGSVRGKLGAPKAWSTASSPAWRSASCSSASRAGRNDGLWPVASEQTGTLLITLAVAVKTRAALRIPVRAATCRAGRGRGYDRHAGLFYATHYSMLAIAAVLVSLYPGVTVMLARAVLHERFTPSQHAGLGLATLAIVAIALN